MQKTRFPFEIIIGEDESTDGTREICQEYALNNPKIIRLFLRSRDNVVHVNGNPTGRYNFIQNIKEAKGKYIANCPGDDYWTDPYKLQKQVTILESYPEYVACFHETQLVYEDGSLGKIYGHDAPQILNAEDTISTVSPLHSSSIIFRKDAFFVPDWFYDVVSGDMAFFSIISKKGNFIKIPEIMSHYNKHKDGLTNTNLVKDNLHSDRIILVNHLNSFHEYKYHEKSKQVISYHHRRLNENQSNLINVESNYFDRTAIHQLPNCNYKQEPRVNTPSTMLNDSEIKLLYWLSKDFFTGSGTLVELGSWLGGSTAAFAQGILNNKNITSKKIFSYDNFIWTPWYNKYNLGIKKSVGDSFLDIYLQNINQWKEIVNVRHGDVCELGWHGDPIELLFIDIMKSIDTAKCVARSFFPSLIPENSLVIHQDYKHFHEFWIHMMMFRLRNHLIPVLNILDAPTVIFKCIKQINQVDIDYSCSFDTFTKNEINNAFKFSLDITKGSNNVFVDEIKNANIKAIEYFENVHPKSAHDKTRVINTLTSQNDNFLNPKISANFCDLYIIRKIIKERLTQSLKLFSGKLLDVGCGQMPYKEFILNSNPSIQNYIGLDFVQGKYADLKHPDITWNGKSIPLEDASIDCAMATEVLEHCHDPLSVLIEIRRTLKPTGIFFFTIPFLWPIHDAPHDHYRYTPFAMQKLLSDAGFEDIQIEAMGGWNASLAQMIGLWLKRAPMPEHVRQKATADLFPFYQQLINTDIIPSDFSSNTMAIGFSGTARKRSFLCDQRSSESKNSQSQTHTESSSKIKSNTKLTIIQSGFPSLSATFIIDQMTGLIDRGVTIQNWATYDPKLSSIHPSIHSYDLLSKTRYLKLVPRESDDSNEWVEKFLTTNKIKLNEIGTIHVHYGSNFVELEPLFKTLNNHVVVSFHGHDASRYFKQHGDNCYEYLFTRADIITTPSYVMKDELVKRGCNPNKIRIHRYGINLDEFNPDSRNFDSKRIIFLTVGRLVEKKGIEFSIKAFSKICNEIDCELRIIGDGPLSKKLINLVHHLKISNKVIFLGEQNKEVVIREMKLADIFVLTSVTASDGDQEGVPVSLTEAQAMGLPAISSFHSGIPELVQHQKTGLLSREKDIPDIAKNMLFLAKNNDIRKEFSIQSRNRVLSEFNIEILNDNLLGYMQPHHPQMDLELEKTHHQILLNNKLILVHWREKLNLYAQHIESYSELRQNSSPAISIIVISWRLHPHTVKSFHILSKQQDLNFELIFVDNGAKQGEFDCLTPYIDTYVHLNSNSGAYLARNIGSIFAKAPILFFLDDDAIPADNIIESHLNCFKKYDVIAVRGVCKPKTNNPLNQLAKHYYLGPKPFPIYADIEGNTSYLASPFFKAGGWDDEIRFGGGGVDLSRRLLEIEPDMRKQIYSPDPIIFHDYAVNSEHLGQKKIKQQESHNRLKIKHSDYDRFLTAWTNFTEREDLLLKRTHNSCKIHNRSINSLPKKNNHDLPKQSIKDSNLISICIPTYNREKYIRETIQSALDQNYDNSEIIVIDDGSTDNTETIVNSFVSNKIKYFKKNHTNSPDTRNRCISEAKGKFILWLDSDDILAPNLIFRFLDTLSEYPDIDVCYGDIQPFGDLGSFSRKIITYEDYYKNNAHLLAGLVLGNKIPNPGTFIRKDLFSKVGMYNTDFRRAHDYDFWIRCAPVATFKHIGMTSLFWRWHKTNMSSENINYDTSFESRLLAKMIQDHTLQTLFPTLEWKKNKTATLIAHSELARMFIHWKDFESAISQLELGLKSILPDLATPKTDMIISKLNFFEQTYLALFQSSENAYFQKIANIIGRTRISKDSLVCNTANKFNTSQTAEPIVSVIIPTYNRPEQLLTAVQSVREQSLTNIEIIVVNDCGVDVSKILQKLNDPRIIYIRHDNNKGLSASRNTGIRASKGTYVAYLDDDDRYFPHHLQTLITSLSNTQYKIAYTDSYRAYKFLDNGKLITIKRDCPYSIDFDKDLLLVKNIIPSNCIMHQKSCFEHIGMFDEALSSHEDWDLWIRLSREFNFLHLKEITCEFSWRVDGSTMTSSGDEDYLQTRKIIYQRYNKYAINNASIIEQQQRLLQKISKRKPLNVLTDKFFSKASIIIPTWNNVLLTEQCLKAIKHNTNYPNFEIIIIDNGSNDETEQLLRNFNSDVVIIKNTENLGFAKACNQGAMAANGQYLVFLNNDTIPQKGWLSELISFMNLHPDAGIAGSKLLYPDDTIQHCGAAMRFDGKFFRHPYKYLHRNHPLVNRTRELDAVTAACFITPRELFFKLGKFDEHYLNGCEDMDYCSAVRRSGATIHYVPTSELYHLESQTPRPEDKDRENFQRYLSKWGKTGMQNEVEIYAKDGFWIQEGNQYSPSPNAVTLLKDLGLNFNPSCPTPAETFQKIVKRIFPLEHWSKTD
jgi:glycosyltransferase involved in cell wall biosynthesis/SAM-dependent methyltransferase